MEIPVLGNSITLVDDRSLDCLASDTSAVRAIVQAAVSVELFTIPLYMTTLYSIQGTHQINSKQLDYYQGRQWPGASASARPATDNQRAFNLIFSVFIQEMLHLQMAANLANAIGEQPDFTPAALVDKTGLGWRCYGPQHSVLPHIIDLKDTDTYRHVRVNLEALNDNQIALFRAIEQPEADARAELAKQPPSVQEKYFPTVPFSGWTADKGVNDLPMFGTIGWMYECLAQYISIEYQDGETLWQKLFRADSVQQDMFNSHAQGSGHPMMEFPHFDTRFTAEDGLGVDTSFNKAIDMMSAITDQGEGSDIGIARYRRGLQLQVVQGKYREDFAALKVDYPSYTGSGEPAPSADAHARHDSSALTHFERFTALALLLPGVETWEQWHQRGNSWSASLLTNADYNPATAPANIPAPDAVAGALNRLKQDQTTMWPVLSKVSVGAIAGITTVLNDYWQHPGMDFPYPSMVGSGDRISLCWAVFGMAPDLSLDIGQRDPGTLYHACQGMSLDGSSGDSCAAIEIYHTCRGSNSCRAEGGCGFVQCDSDSGGGHSCSALAHRAPATGQAAQAMCGRSPTVDKGGQVLCGGPSPDADLYSAPGDNKCKSFGGCAVPISASQMFPRDGQMQLYDFAGPPYQSEPFGEPLDFAVGESVYDKAWQAYGEVMAQRGKTAGEPPAPTDLRLALPPST